MTNHFLYIDPGTGSMLFSLAIGIVTTLVFATRAAVVKIRFLLSGGKTAKISENKIPYLIYSDHKRYWNVFKPVCDEFERHKIPLVYYTQSADDPALSEKYEFVKAEFIGEGNRGLVRMNMLNAGTVISTTPGLDVLQWRRSKTADRYIHIPHTVTDLSDYRMFGLDHYDAVLCTGQNQVDFIRKIEGLRPTIKRKDCVIVGSTYLDANLERARSLAPHLPSKDNPTVLVAPSWGMSSILNRFGEVLISSLLGSGLKVIVRPHPQSLASEKEMLETLETKFAGKEIEWNFDNDNLSVLNRADILITDFSGIIFDYALIFDRPLIYAETNFDTSPYDADWLDERMWTFRAAEKIGIKLEEKDFHKIGEIIRNAMASERMSEEREKVKKECWQNIGGAAKAIFEYATSNEKN